MMADYLNAVPVDYDEAALVLSPQNIIGKQGGYIQHQKKADAGNVKTASLDTPPYFIVTLEWSDINKDDKRALYQFYLGIEVNNQSGAGTIYSFNWYHPIDSVYYAAKFATPLNEHLFNSDVHGVEIELIVFGNGSI